MSAPSCPACPVAFTCRLPAGAASRSAPPTPARREAQRYVRRYALFYAARSRGHGASAWGMRRPSAPNSRSLSLLMPHQTTMSSRHELLLLMPRARCCHHDDCRHAAVTMPRVTPEVPPPRLLIDAVVTLLPPTDGLAAHAPRLAPPRRALQPLVIPVCRRRARFERLPQCTYAAVAKEMLSRRDAAFSRACAAQRRQRG